MSNIDGVIISVCYLGGFRGQRLVIVGQYFCAGESEDLRSEKPLNQIIFTRFTVIIFIFSEE